MIEKEITRALRCIADKEEIPCAECAYNVYNKKGQAGYQCKKKAARDVISLINSKNAENVKLRYALKAERAKKVVKEDFNKTYYGIGYDLIGGNEE